MTTNPHLEAVAEFFRERDLNIEVIPEDHAIRLQMELTDGFVHFYTQIDPDVRVHSLVVRYPIFSRPEAFDRCCNFTCRHNAAVTHTHLIFSPESGHWGLRLTFNRDTDGAMNMSLFSDALSLLIRHAQTLYPILIRLVSSHESPSTLMEQFEAMMLAGEDDDHDQGNGTTPDAASDGTTPNP